MIRYTRSSITRIPTLPSTYLLEGNAETTIYLVPSLSLTQTNTEKARPKSTAAKLGAYTNLFLPRHPSTNNKARRVNDSRQERTC